MPNLKLVEYIRKHLKQFGADALCQKLREEDVPEAEIQEALKAALKSPQQKPNLIRIVLLLVVIGAIAWVYLSPDHPSLSSFRNGGPKPGSEKTFMGHYGYILQVPEGYNTLSDFLDSEKTREVVYLFPKGLDPSHLTNEGLYGQLGILRLEASPLRSPERRIGTDTVRTGVVGILQNRKAVYTMRDVQVGGLPGFLVNISQPVPLMQAYVVGAKVLYVLTAGAEDPAFNNTLASLHEASTRDLQNNP